MSDLNRAERKILGEAARASRSTRKRNAFGIGLLVMLLGSAIICFSGVAELFRENGGVSDATKSIGFSLVLMAAAGGAWHYERFRADALSLIRKLSP